LFGEDSSHQVGGRIELSSKVNLDFKGWNWADIESDVWLGSTSFIKLNWWSYELEKSGIVFSGIQEVSKVDNLGSKLLFKEGS